VRERPELEVPLPVVDAFERYLAEWAAAMEADEFRWEGEVDADELQAGVPGASGDDEVTALVDDCLNGDYSACDTLLYTLADECSAGYLLSCDVLYQVSAVGSAYEDYGATCGGRVYDWTYAGVCSEV
jgi:hypothetical protein